MLRNCYAFQVMIFKTSFAPPWTRKIAKGTLLLTALMR
jgi:hypothetical protein